MCGIVGIVETGGAPIDPDILENLTASLTHRGPDDSGIFVANGNGRTPSVGFGHRRLSIIDLSPLGHQPMCNEDGRVWVTYNGEIYNFKKLKAELTERGHAFRSQCDTEVIIHGYEEFGTDIFSRLNGMFALAIWDSRSATLIMARDRYGEKPLYYWQHEGRFVFASEQKAFCRHPRFTRALNMRTLTRYLAFEYQPLSHSIYEDVAELPPAHYLVLHDGAAAVSRYWDISFSSGQSRMSTDEKELGEELVGRLKKAVEERLMSDVPIGVFLSGGIDSTAVVSLMAECMEPSRIKTFSIGFQEKSFDESTYAKTVARHFGTDHHEKILSPQMALDILPKIWDMLDEPFADASIIPTYLLSSFTRETVTVALGGDGGDELFAGYDPFLAQVFARAYEKLPKPLHRAIIEPLVRALPVSHRNMSLEFRLKQFLKGMNFDFPARNQVWLGAFSPQEQRKVLSADAAEHIGTFDPLSEITPQMNMATYRDDIDELIYYYCRFYLAEDILTKVDRASMAASLEVRSPFLDADFAQFVNTLSSSLKLRGMTRKYILKKAFSSRFPPGIIARKKKGFGVPLSKWFRQELKPVLTDVFAPEKIRAEGLFDPAYITNLLESHFAGARDNRKQIWTLLMFQMWKQRFG